MSDAPRVPVRREPPRFRAARVVAYEPRSTSMQRLTLAGPELVGLERGDAASSVRLLLPADDGELELPSWNGNEFLLDDGRRARIRTLTPLAVRDDGASAELDVDVVLHGDSPLTRWARAATPGTPAAVSGTGSGYVAPEGTTSLVVLGDESAVPAVTTLLEDLPPELSVDVVLEHRHDAEPVELPDRDGASVRWVVSAPDAAPCDALVAAASNLEPPAGSQVWAAGEAAGVQRLRRRFFDELGMSRRGSSIRGYWKHGREGT